MTATPEQQDESPGKKCADCDAPLPRGTIHTECRTCRKRGYPR